MRADPNQSTPVWPLPDGLQLPPVSYLDFYATVDSESIRPFMPSNVPYLLPASSWARNWEPSWDRPIPAPLLPPHITRTAADCGGFVAMFKWGEYRYHRFQYIAWCHAIGPSLAWAAMMDYPCQVPPTEVGGLELRASTP